MSLTRRDFLRYAVTSSLAGATLLGMPSAFTAHAAQTQGYKALVCVFLFGGVDGHDILIPYDHESYNSFANIRQSLLNQYQGARSRESLLPFWRRLESCSSAILCKGSLKLNLVAQVKSFL